MPGPPLIAHVIYRLDYGGLENGLVNLINGLAPERYRHVVICLAGFSEFRSRIRRLDVEVISIDKRPGKDPASYFRLWKLLRRLQPAIVHTRNLGTVDLQWIAFLAGVRARVHGEHGWEASDPHGRNPRHARIRRACRPAIQRYVAVSRDIANWLERRIGVPTARIRQIYNGVDDKRFSPGTKDGSVLPWGTDVLVVGTVGRLDPVKNHAQLLRCFGVLTESSEPWAGSLRLLVVGAGQLRGFLESEAARLGLKGRVWFAGARDDVPQLMQRMDIFVLSSLNEGISNTILEAMAMGKPVVASAVGGNPELILEGVTGATYDPSDDVQLIRALRHFLSDASARQASGTAARKLVLSHFGLQSMIDSYASLYDELLCAA